MTEYTISASVEKLPPPHGRPSFAVFPSINGRTVNLEVYLSGFGIDDLRTYVAALDEALKVENRVENDSPQGAS